MSTRTRRSRATAGDARPPATTPRSRSANKKQRTSDAQPSSTTRLPPSDSANSHPTGSPDGRDYHSEAYWERRYARQLQAAASTPPDAAAADDADDVTSEWYYDWQTLTPLLSISPRMRSSPVLDLGCGLSSLFDELIAAGFTGPFCGIDSSPSIIDRRRSLVPPAPSSSPSPSSPAPPSITFLSHDLFSFSPSSPPPPPLLPSHYGLIIDKATSDGMMCDDANSDGIERMYEMVGWALRPGGVLVVVSVQEPEGGWLEEMLVPGLVRGGGEACSWHVTVHEVGEGGYHDGCEGPNVFVCKKGERERKARSVKESAGDEVVIVHKLH